MGRSSNGETKPPSCLVSDLYQCHILEHEEMGMMRNFRIT
jgi:hypothetical protein